MAKRSTATERALLRRGGVFVSYSHADEEWLDRLRVFLRPLERDFGVTVWADTQLRAGQKWREAITKAVEQCQAALLLVSANFLASDFITTDELPPLLEAADRDGVIIMPVILGSVSKRLYTLSHFQAVNPLSRPLNTMTEAEQERVFVKVTDEILDAFHGIEKAASGIGVVDQMYDELHAASRSRPTLAKRHRALIQATGSTLVEYQNGKPLKVITAKDMRKLPKSTRAYLAVYERGMRDSLRKWKAAYPKIRQMRDDTKRAARIQALLRPMKKDLEGILGFFAGQGMYLDDHYQEFRDLVAQA